MGLQILDGRGRGYLASVDTDNKLRTLATSETRMAYESAIKRTAYIWTASLDLGADKNVMWLRNDSTDDFLSIYSVVMYASAATNVEFYVGSGNTVGGTVVTGINLHVGSGDVAKATCRHTNTNVDAGAGMTLMATAKVGVSGEEQVDFDGALILDYNHELALNVVTDIALITINIIGYFHPINS